MDECENPDCPQCTGMGAYLGTLGYFLWFRCIQCGWDFSIDMRDAEGNE